MRERMLRTRKARDRYGGIHASARTWLYPIATNACLHALVRQPLPLPSNAERAERPPGTPLDRDRQSNLDYEA